MAGLLVLLLIPAIGVAGASAPGARSIGSLPATLMASLTVTPQNMALGTSATFTTTANGGVFPYSYSYAGLPLGCSDTDVASFPCAPIVPGTFHVTVTVTDAADIHAFGATNLTVVAPSTGNSTLRILSFSAIPATIVEGNTTLLQVVAAGGTAPFSYLYVGLPNGCGSSPVADLMCEPREVTPTSVTWTIAVVVNDSAGHQVNASTNLTVLPNPSLSNPPSMGGFGVLPAVALATVVGAFGLVFLVAALARSEAMAARPPRTSRYTATLESLRAGPASMARRSRPPSPPPSYRR